MCLIGPRGTTSSEQWAALQTLKLPQNWSNVAVSASISRRQWFERRAASTQPTSPQPIAGRCRNRVSRQMCSVTFVQRDVSHGDKNRQTRGSRSSRAALRSTRISTAHSAAKCGCRRRRTREPIEHRHPNYSHRSVAVTSGRRLWPRGPQRHPPSLLPLRAR